LRKQSMPPKRRPQPGAEAIKPVLAWLETFSQRMEQQARLDRVTMRRLNRVEYENTVERQPGARQSRARARRDPPIPCESGALASARSAGIG
jgi:hypothetical protein